MDQELAGKTALITGASRGIGAATAISLARNGVSRFVLHYNSNRQGIEKVLGEVRGLGAEGVAIQANLGQVAGIHDFLDKLKHSRVEPDILVNNAGSLVKRAKLLEFTEELYDEVMNLNVKSAWFITQAVVPAMLRRSGGAIVNLSSIAAWNGGGAGATVYAAAKATNAAALFKKSASRSADGPCCCRCSGCTTSPGGSNVWPASRPVGSPGAATSTTGRRAAGAGSLTRR